MFDVIVSDVTSFGVSVFGHTVFGVTVFSVTVFDVNFDVSVFDVTTFGVTGRSPQHVLHKNTQQQRGIFFQRSRLFTFWTSALDSPFSHQ